MNNKLQLNLKRTTQRCPNKRAHRSQGRLETERIVHRLHFTSRREKSWKRFSPRRILYHTFPNVFPIFFPRLPEGSPPHPLPSVLWRRLSRPVQHTSSTRVAPFYIETRQTWATRCFFPRYQCGCTRTDLSYSVDVRTETGLVVRASSDGDHFQPALQLVLGKVPVHFALSVADGEMELSQDSHVFDAWGMRADKGVWVSQIAK